MSNVNSNGRRIALIFSSLRPGGVERVRLILAREFLRRGYKVDFVVQNADGPLKAEVPPGVRVVELGTTRVWGTVRSLIAYFRETEPEAVLASVWMMTTMAATAFKLAKSTGVLILSDHNPLTSQYARAGVFRRMLLRVSVVVTYRFANAIVAVSREIADDLASLGGFKKSRIVVINNPVEPSLKIVHKQNSRQVDAWLSATDKKILAVGTLKPQKNFSVLIEAASILSTSLPIALLIAGEGSERLKLEKLICDRGLADRIFLCGHVDYVDALYQYADVFVLSSDYEGFGNVILEALSAGTTVVSTDCGGPREILDGGRFGQLVPTRNPSALAEAIFKAATEPCDPVPLRRRANEYAPRSIVTQYLETMGQEQ